jgi:hypothetical protein
MTTFLMLVDITTFSNELGKMVVSTWWNWWLEITPNINGDALNTYMNDSVRNYHSLIGLFDITILSW